MILRGVDYSSGPVGAEGLGFAHSSGRGDHSHDDGDFACHSACPSNWYGRSPVPWGRDACPTKAGRANSGARPEAGRHAGEGGETRMKKVNQRTQTASGPNRPPGRALRRAKAPNTPAKTNRFRACSLVQVLARVLKRLFPRSPFPVPCSPVPVPESPVPRPRSPVPLLLPRFRRHGASGFLL